MRQTALFEVAGTGGLPAWKAPAGYWPTDGVEGGVCWGWGGVCWGEGWLMLSGDLPVVATGTCFSNSLHETNFVDTH